MVIASEPQLLGNAHADHTGAVLISAKIPDDLAPGAHTLAVFAPNSGIGYSQRIVVPATDLPTTGSTTLAFQLPLLGFAAGLLLLTGTRRPLR